MPRQKKETTGIKPLSPFDIIGYMFTNQEKFNEIPLDVLAKHYYIINDRFSIQFPLQAAVFNHYKISLGNVVKCWNNFIQKFHYSRTPSWMFVKGKAKTNENKKANDTISKESIKQYAEYLNVSSKEVEFALKLYPEQVKSEIKEYEKELAEIEKLKKANLNSLKFNEETPEMELDMENVDAIF